MTPSETQVNSLIDNDLSLCPESPQPSLSNKLNSLIPGLIRLGVPKLQDIAFTDHI